MEVMTEKMVNGVNVTKLEETIEAVKGNPAIADFTFRTSNTWLTGGHNRSTIKGFYGACAEDATRTMPFVLDNDEPEVLLGEDNGANPVEYVLHALAGCLTTSMIYHAAARGIAIEGISSQLKGYLDLQGFLGLKPIPRGYQDIKIQFTIQGDFTQEEKENIVGLGRQYSPTYEMMKKAVPSLSIAVV